MPLSEKDGPGMGITGGDLFSHPEPDPGDLLFSLELDCTPDPPRRKRKRKPGQPEPEERTVNPVVPSWNDILAMEQWQRHRFKRALAHRFLSALRSTAADSSMKTTSAKSTLWTYCATLERYLVMLQARRASIAARKKLERKSGSLFSSKSSDFDNPPF